MKKSLRLLMAGLSLTLVLASCGEEAMNGLDDTSLPANGNTSTDTNTNTSTATGSASTSTGTASSSNPGAANPLAEFVKSGDTYFGPTGANTNLDVSLSGNDAAGSRYGGPDDAVGVLVVVRNNKGYMEVVNLENKNRFPVVYASTGEAFNVPADTLGGKPFPSLFVGEIASLTEFKFDHRVAPNPEKCNQYTATYNGAAVSSGNGKYLAKVTSSQGACRYTKAGV